jgi:hypothetical protein
MMNDGYGSHRNTPFSETNIKKTWQHLRVVDFPTVVHGTIHTHPERKALQEWTHGEGTEDFLAAQSKRELWVRKRGLIGTLWKPA